MSIRKPFIRFAAAGTGVAMSLLLTAAPAMAKSGDARSRNACSVSGRSEMRVTPDKGALRVEFKVESRTVGQTYDVTITDNGGNVFTGQRTTSGSSGEFKVRLNVPNQVGSDTLSGSATQVGGGNSCSSTATTTI